MFPLYGLFYDQIRYYGSQIGSQSTYEVPHFGRLTGAGNF